MAKKQNLWQVFCSLCSYWENFTSFLVETGSDGKSPVGSQTGIKHFFKKIGKGYNLCWVNNTVTVFLCQLHLFPSYRRERNQVKCPQWCSQRAIKNLYLKKKKIILELGFKQSGNICFCSHCMQNTRFQVESLRPGSHIRKLNVFLTTSDSHDM